MKLIDLLLLMETHFKTEGNIKECNKHINSWFLCLFEAEKFFY